MKKVLKSKVLWLLILITLEIQKTIYILNSSHNEITGNFFFFVIKLDGDVQRGIINFPLIIMLLILILNIFMLDKDFKDYDKD